jgi:hypothetical protein
MRQVDDRTPRLTRQDVPHRDGSFADAKSVRLQIVPATWPVFPVLAVMAVGWLVFSWPWLSGAVTIPWDAKAHFQPQIQFLAASVARGEWPFWTPNVFAGHPQIADPQSMMFSPPVLLLALLNAAPSLRAVDTMVLLTVLAGGCAVVLLCRDFGWHWAAAIIAALAFQFGGAMAWRLQHFGQVMSLAYLPFALFFLRRALERSSITYGAAAGMMGAFIVLGRDQVGLLSVYLLAGYVIWWWWTAPSLRPAIKSSAIPLTAGAVVGLALIAIPLALTLLLAEQSNRPSIDFTGAGRGSLHPALLVTSAVPHLFGAAGPMDKYWGPPSFTWTGTDLFIAQNVGQLYLGAIPLFLLIVGVVRGVLWSRDMRFFTVAAVLALLYALGWYTPVFRLLYEVLPGVDLYRRPADATFLVGGLGALLAGYVTHRLFTDDLPPPARWQRVVEIGVVVVLFALCIAFAVRWDRLAMAWPPLLLAIASVGLSAVALYAAAYLKTRHTLVAGGLLIVALTADLAINNGPNGASALPPAEIAMLEPSAPTPLLKLIKTKLDETGGPHMHRVELAGLGYHWPNASMTHGFDNTLGTNPVRMRLYSEATGAQDTVGLPDQRKFAPLFPSYRSPLADLLGLRFIATGVPIEQIDPKLKPGDVTLIARTPEGYLYENPRALPRVLFAHQIATASFDRMLTDGAWPAVDLATTVVLERASPSVARRPGSARLVRYTNTEVTIEADSPDGGWIVLADMWHPWWFVDVNGLPAKLERANVLFRAVEVPAGRQTIRFVFRPLAGALHEVTDRK